MNKRLILGEVTRLIFEANVESTTPRRIGRTNFFTLKIIGYYLP